MELSPSLRLVAAADVIVRFMDDEAVLLNLGTGQYLGLDAVGARMWVVLLEAPSVHAAYERLLSEYEVEGERLLWDLSNFVEELLGHQLARLEPLEGLQP